MKLKGEAVQQFTPLNNNDVVVVIEEYKKIPDSIPSKTIGEFHLKDGGLTVDCSYEHVLSLAKNEARKLGGNAIKITAHKLPNALSICHQITFKILKIDDIFPFQNMLIWSTKHTLDWKYFKGAPKLERPSFLCATINVDYKDYKIGGKGRVEVLPVIVLSCSYIQPNYQNKHQLEYNQLKFDLLELYARKMRDAFNEAKVDSQIKWQKFAEGIYNEIFNDFETEIYYLETETNFGLEYTETLRWKYRLKEELAETSSLSTDTI
ncbi:hypothetical protein [Zunongwangia pacifica]|uniref:Uncharacterized protein n=1 Tax=Zunongwangia pacifica TaxID=2911062 RepID=A0A9X2CMK3_9FLAO|nr:hypothetical protein [Zunongwangia pacifica]MCL6217604.1 hypothetical protein [Zunongwangia pacifica]